MPRFKIHYLETAPNDDVIGRIILIDADCLEDAEALACFLARGDENIVSVRLWPREAA